MRVRIEHSNKTTTGAVGVDQENLKHKVAKLCGKVVDGLEAGLEAGTIEAVNYSKTELMDDIQNMCSDEEILILACNHIVDVAEKYALKEAIEAKIRSMKKDGSGGRLAELLGKLTGVDKSDNSSDDIEEIG